MKAEHLNLSGVSSRRLILLPEELTDEHEKSESGRRPGRPRIRRYRLGVLAGAVPAAGASRKPAVAPLARALRT